MSPVIAVLIGTIAGVIVGWWIGSRGGSDNAPSLEQELRAQISAAQEREATAGTRAQSLQAELTAQATLAATARADADASSRLLSQRGQEFRDQLSSLAQRETDLAAQVGNLQEQVTTQTSAATRSRAEAEAASERLLQQDRTFQQQLVAAKQAQEQSLQSLRDTFGALAAEALNKNNPEFLRLAQQNFKTLQEAAKGDLESRQQAIAALLIPLEQQLKTYQDRLQQSETSQTAAVSEVKKQLETLGQQSKELADETGRFRMALSSSQARGRWGEATLRRLVEVAGMSPHCDFTEQEGHEDGRPDMLVRLPGNRVIVVDSKAPDFNVAERLRGAPDQNRDAILREHALLLRGTVKALAERSYQTAVEHSLDYIVMFIPAESVFSLALESDPELLIWAAQQRIMLATPASLIALLRSVSLSWQQYEQTQNSRKIAEEASTLYRRVTVLAGHFDAIRSGLAGATRAFNAAIGSYEHSVRPSGQRMLDMGVEAQGEELPEIESVNLELRTPEVRVES